MGRSNSEDKVQASRNIKEGTKKVGHIVFIPIGTYISLMVFSPISMSNDSSLLLYVSRPFSPVDSLTAVFSYNLVITVFSSFMSNASPLLLYVNWPVFSVLCVRVVYFSVMANDSSVLLYVFWPIPLISCMCNSRIILFNV